MDQRSRRTEDVVRFALPWNLNWFKVDRSYGIAYDTNMSVPQIVLDPNVLVAALRSRRGASFRVLSLADGGAFEINVSVPLVLEYEDVLRREISKLTVSQGDIGDLIDYMCHIGNRHQVHFLWRPLLKRSKDDMVLELAVTANCDYIVTYNRRDFQGVEPFGLKVIEPVELLRIIGDLP